MGNHFLARICHLQSSCRNQTLRGMLHRTHLSGNITGFHLLDNCAINNVINNIPWDTGPGQQAPKERIKTKGICNT